MKLSVITINYNNLSGLQKTSESILSQKWKEFEWILVDGGSSDGSKEYIEKIAKSTDLVTFWCSESDKGVYNAINKGLFHCSGEYVSCMNSGDAFFDEKTLASIFGKEHKADILYGDWLQVFEDHTCMQNFPSPFGIYDFWEKNICHQAMFVKTSVLQAKGFDESFRLLADYKRWVELVLQGAAFEYLGIPVCRYDMTGMSTGGSELLTEEQRRVHEVFPPAVVNTIQRLWHYEHFHQVLRMEALLRKKGIATSVTNIVMKILSSIFL